MIMGGRRFDLETVIWMHVHQKSDYWFDNEVDQGSIRGLSQYLPNNVFMAPVNRLDDRVKATGAQLMSQFAVTVPKEKTAQRITYRLAR